MRECTIQKLHVLIDDTHIEEVGLRLRAFPIGGKVLGFWKWELTKLERV